MKNIYLISDNTSNYDREFLSHVKIVPLLTPPDSFYPKLSERKRIFTHMSLWIKKQTCIILEDNTYTHLNTDDLLNCLTFNHKKQTETDIPAIFFYGKYCDTCLSHDETYECEKQTFYKTQACHGAYAYMVNAAACKVLMEFCFSIKTLDTYLFGLTLQNKLVAYAYHPSIIKVISDDITTQYECMLPEEEKKLYEKKEYISYTSVFIFICMIFFIFLLGLALIYFYRIGLTSRHTHKIRSGYIDYSVSDSESDSSFSV